MVILQTYRHDELKDDWVKDSHTFFIQLKKNETGVDTVMDVTNFLQSLFGFGSRTRFNIWNCGANGNPITDENYPVLPVCPGVNAIKHS